MVYLSPQPIVAEPGPRRTAPLTVATAIAMVETWCDIPREGRVTRISALRLLERLYGKPAEAILLDPAELTQRFLKAGPKALGLKPGSLSVYKTYIRSVLRRLGVMEHPRRQKEPLAPAWDALRARLPDQFMSARLQAFMAWCSDRGVPPDAVGDATLAEYCGYLKANRMKGDPHDITRRCATAWNRMAQTVPGWPSAGLTAPASGFFYTLPFEAYPASLVADIEKFRRRLEGGGESGLYTAESASPRLRPISVDNRLQAIRMALTALVESGTKARDIGLLADIVRPDSMKMILDWHWHRAGDKVTGNLGAIAETLRIIAKYHVGLTEEALEKAVAIAKQAMPRKRRRMTAKNERRLAQFDDETVLAMTLHLAREALMPLAATLKKGREEKAPRSLDAAWIASLALAIEIELHCPMRLANLTNLRLGKEIVCLGNGKQRFTHFLIEGHLTKNEEPLRWRINARLSAMMDTFVTEYRGAIGGASGDYLFAGRDYNNRPRAASRLGTAITEAFREHAGIELNPHLFRALAGKLILDENPGAIEEVRQLLGHRTFATAMEYYISAQSQRAAERHDVRIAKKQQETRLLAKVAFSGFRPSGRSPAAARGILPERR